MSTKYDQLIDEIIEGLCSLLEYSGILSDGTDNGYDGSHAHEDPWLQISKNLKEFLVSHGKLCELLPINSTHLGDSSGGENIVTFAKKSELLLSVESLILDLRANIRSVSAILVKEIPVKLGICNRLESISRSISGLPLSAQLLPMAKSLAGSIRRQKIMWLHSVQLIEDSFDRIYTVSASHEEFTENLLLVYKRLNRKCLDPDCSPWNEALRLLECITGSELQQENIKSRKAKTDSRNLKSLSLSDTKSRCVISELQLFDTTTCASLQLKDIVNQFFHGDFGRNDECSKALSILVEGPEGSGKTYLLETIGKQSHTAIENIEIIQPVLPYDAIGSTVGEAEDLLLSMFSYAKTQEKYCLLILDDIDIIFGQTEKDDREPHSVARLRYLFFSILDMIHEQKYGGRNGKMLLICSSKDNFGKNIDRFDKILPLLPPNGDERKQMISSYVDEGSSSVDDMVECTLGLSRAELAHQCRQALISLHSRKTQVVDTNDFLIQLKQRLQSATPESLKHGVNADFVDMTVLSARDLLKIHPIQNPENDVVDLPLFGENARTSWEELRRLIILPLCYGSSIDKILYHRGRSSSRKAFAGGVLLAAPPGTGKSTLACFCAAVASSINCSIKMIDVSCTSLIHKEVGGSERALHRLFQSARSATPCIVVMDGIENIGAVRGNDNTTEGTMDRVLSTLLTELDGIDSDLSTDVTVGSMAIIGITQNPEWIDPALRRPGRLERTIWLGNPDLIGREQIVVKEFGKAEYRPDGYPELETITDLAKQVALLTDGCTGAELISICNETKISAFNKFFNDDPHAKKDFISPQLVFDVLKAKPSKVLN